MTADEAVTRLEGNWKKLKDLYNHFEGQITAFRSSNNGLIPEHLKNTLKDQSMRFHAASIIYAQEGENVTNRRDLTREHINRIEVLTKELPGFHERLKRNHSLIEKGGEYFN